MLEFPLFFIHERAGIRTPDNLIKSQVITPRILAFMRIF